MNDDVVKKIDGQAIDYKLGKTLFRIIALAIIFLLIMYAMGKAYLYKGIDKSSAGNKGFGITTTDWAVLKVRGRTVFSIVPINGVKPKYMVRLNGDPKREYILPTDSTNGIPEIGDDVVTIWFKLLNGQGIANATIVPE